MAAPPMASLLPSQTVGFVSVADIEQLVDNWQATQLGALVRDESMRPFVEDVQQQMQSKVANVERRLGVSLAELDGLATGEVALAVVTPSQQDPAVVLLGNMGQDEAQWQAVLAKVDGNLSKRGATKTVDRLDSTELVIYKVPDVDEPKTIRTVVLMREADVFALSDSRGVAEGVMSRLKSNVKDRLSEDNAFTEVMKRCGMASQGLSPDLRWFIRPFDFTFAYRHLVGKDPNDRRGHDMAAILRRQGFDGIQALGGHVNLYVSGQYEVLHRTAVYAPPSPGVPSGEKYRLAMQVMSFPAGGDLTPPDWLPRDIATYTSFQIDILNAFDHIDPLADEFLEKEGSWQKVLKGLEENAHGPQINVREEIVVHLGQRVTIATDYDVPITANSERFVVAIESKNDLLLAESIRKLMESDPYKQLKEFDGHAIWETMEQPGGDLPVVEVEEEDPLLEIEFGGNEEQTEPPAFPHSVVCVANGHLFLASDIDFLQRVLTEMPQRERLNAAIDFEVVGTAIRQLTSDSLSARGFSRTDEEYRPTYELLRQGKMPESKTLLGRFLNELLTTDDDEGVRAQKLDATKLPSFESVRRYFGPAGIAVATEEDGWFITGAMLRKGAPEVASLPRPAAK